MLILGNPDGENFAACSQPQHQYLIICLKTNNTPFKTDLKEWSPKAVSCQKPSDKLNGVKNKHISFEGEKKCTHKGRTFGAVDSFLNGS